MRGWRDYWDISPAGRMHLHADMTFEWQAGAGGNQFYLLKKLRDGKPNDHEIEAV